MVFSCPITTKGQFRMLLLMMTLIVLSLWYKVGPTIHSIIPGSGLNLTRTLSPFSSFEPQSTASHCTVDCTAGIPCKYVDESPFRIIVLTFNRPDSLLATLNSIHSMDTLGDRVNVEIWMDRFDDGAVDKKTLAVARNFTHDWQKGLACVHIQDKHVYIRGQWIDTWRARDNSSKEIVLLLEDDIDISPHTYRWLRAVHQKYDQRSDISGYTLQMENVRFKAGKQGPMTAPKTDTVFMYPVTGTWGFSPHNLRWREFQDWFHVAVQNKSFHPYVPGIISTTWYKKFEQEGTSDRVWAIWHHYFNYRQNLYCVYSNLKSFTKKASTLLSANRRESGLHFAHAANRQVSRMLMKSWSDSYIRFPEETIQFHYNGTVARRV